MKSTPTIAVLASGEGSNFQALCDATQSGVLNARIVGLVASRAGIGVLEKAKTVGVPAQVLNPKSFPDRGQWDQQVLKTLQNWKAEWVVLAGFLSLIGPEVLKTFPQRIVNIHPALLPKFGGAGMYGIRVHQAVIEARASETGITIHLVDGEYDRGRVLAQVKIPVTGISDAAVLADRVRELEHEHYPRVLNDLVWGRLTQA